MRTLALLLFASLVFGNCPGCVSPSRPPYPPEIDPTMYASEIEARRPLSEEKSVGVFLLGMRLAKKGCYIDLLVQGVPPSDAGGLGFGMSRNPNRMTIESPSGRAVELMPWQPPRPTVPLFMTVSFAEPPVYLVDEASPERGLVEVCIYRTKSQLEPGSYRVRLLAPPRPRPSRAIDTSWHTLYADWTPQPTD